MSRLTTSFWPYFNLKSDFRLELDIFGVSPRKVEIKERFVNAFALGLVFSMYVILNDSILKAFHSPLSAVYQFDALSNLPNSGL